MVQPKDLPQTTCPRGQPKGATPTIMQLSTAPAVVVAPTMSAQTKGWIAKDGPPREGRRQLGHNLEMCVQGREQTRAQHQQPALWHPKLASIHPI